MIKVENFQFPLIIAMEDHSGSQSNNGGKVSQELAKFLRCPLISENDVAEALQKFPLTTSSKSAKYQVPNELAQHLPFEAVIQIASTQLSLGINVVINTQLSHPANVEKLVQLESNGKARLIIIEFDTNDQHHNYNVGNVKKLLVDEESFDVEEVIDEMSTLLQHTTEDNAIKNQKKIKPPTIDHLHALSLSEKPKEDKLLCKSCSNLISGSCYECVDCNEFILHKSCGESAPNVKVLSQNRPSFLSEVKPDQYDLEDMQKCANCEEFQDDCCDCLLQTHLRHGFVPTILYPKQHEHFLNFIIMPFKYNYQYKCCVCDELGSSVSYKCYDCFYDVHVNCILPGTIKMNNGQYSFFLDSSSSHHDEPEDHSCDVCRREIDSRELFYRCEQRNLAIHMKCVPADPILADIPSRKKPTGLKFVKSIPYTEAQLRQIFKSADRDKDGLLSVRELSEAFKSLGFLYPAFRAHRAMRIADSNRDGYIDGKELEDVIKYTLKIGHGPVDGIVADEDLRVQKKENNHI
ncbi:hypothetical protein P3X46_021005 [Hevea brasiliensis]|uniref:EF-hand domain-containing protein n=1 Tax=Hevea brasiliensis TaxID=3981 RepID=A0ABQ9LHZ9_HEVBR|nr:hypothetical protein P3X46_021005 [Hevea brasiliensis]